VLNKVPQEGVFGEQEVQLYAFLTSATDGCEWSTSRPGCFTPRVRTHGTVWRGGWVGPRTGLDEVAKRKSPYACRELSPGHPARESVTTVTELPYLTLSPRHDASSGCWRRRRLMYWIISRVEPTKGGPPACKLVEDLTTPHRKKKTACCEMLHSNLGVHWRIILDWILGK
jgi:hypothetical protein